MKQNKEGHGGNESSNRKRTASDSKRDVSPPDRKRVKDEHNAKSEEKKEGRPKVKHSSSKPSKPLQEPKISSSENVKADPGNCSLDAETKDGDNNTSPTSEKNQTHISVNNNVPEKEKESEAKKTPKIQEFDLFQQTEEPDSKRSQSKPQKRRDSQKDAKHKHTSKRSHHGTDKEKRLDQREVCELSANSLDSRSTNKRERSHDSCNEKSKEKEAEIKDTEDASVVKKEEDLTRDNDDQSKSERKGETEVKKEKKENIKTEKEKSERSGKNKKSTSEGKRKEKGNVAKGESRKKKVKKEGDEEGKSKKDAKKEEEDNKWKWWEEGERDNDGKKWTALEHKGPLFPPKYESLPNDVSFLYNGKAVKLSVAAEEVATFYAKMLEHDYTTKEAFQENFFADWRKEMTEEERGLIKKLPKCDFTAINKYFIEKSEERKAMTKKEKQVLKEDGNKLTEEFGFCILDGHREKIGNFRVEPPGLFRGRGEHPKMGKLKRRIQPKDITINCSIDSKVPVAPEGHRWKKVQHDNLVTWLASWVENIQGHTKYVMLNPSSKLKGEKDWQKYEVARKLKLVVESIRRRYRNDWKDREMKNRQRGVALYFIDKLALRSGTEKDGDETADTVGCCSLRVEHIKLHEKKDGMVYVVEFDFLGKDSIRYYNQVPVESRVFKNLKLFVENKEPIDDLFDRISTIDLNKHLNQAMPGLTGKVFRTFNASTTLQDQLNKLTTADMTLEEKLLSYNRANRAVAILCNHQRAAPKTFEKSMQLMQEKIAQKEQQLEEARKELKEAKKAYKMDKTDKNKKLLEKKEATVKRLEDQLKKLQLQMTDREENKVIALGTSKLNYLDPRISVAWCRKFKVPLEKIYNKAQRDKFAWAIDMTEEEFQF